MGIVSLLSTIIYVATFFTMFLAVFSYTAFKLREGQRKKKLKTGAAGNHTGPVTAPHQRLLRVYLVDRVELVGIMKWYDKMGVRMSLLDGREVTVSKNAILYCEELDQAENLIEAEAKNATDSRLRTIK